MIPPSPQLENLGYGTGVKVFRIERSPRLGIARSPWAIKKLCKRNTDDDKLFKQRLTEEADLLRTLNHPNIVGWRGYKETLDGNNALILEDCHISLGNILETRMEDELSSLPANDIKIVCRDISKALDYLHTSVFLLHGDMKSFNVLIKGDFEICKLCDFGVSQPLNQDGYLDLVKKPSASYVGTDLWNAPEVFIPDNEENISFKADIFSFGMVIYECISLMPPHMCHLTEDKENSVVTVSDDDDKIKSTNPVKKLNMNVSSITISDDDDDTDAEKSNNPLEVNKTSNKFKKKSNDSSITTITDGEEDHNGTETDESSFDIQTVLGTRPPLPEATSLSEDYNIVVELFYMCTNTNPEDRPTAKSISNSFE